MDKFFPPYLNQGSQGPAVKLLQLLLKAGGYEQDEELIADGDYGPVTANAVKALQAELSIEVDGNFGPETRKAFLQDTEIDIDKIPADYFVGETKAA